MSCTLNFQRSLGHRRLAIALAASTVLSACGGGGGGEAGINAIPPPPASPTSPSTPASGFANASATSVGYGVGIGYAGRADGPAKPSEEKWSITYDAGSQTYSVSGDWPGVTFGPATSSVSSDFRTYVTTYSKPTQGESHLDVLRTGNDGAGNTRIRLSHLSYALWSNDDSVYGGLDRIIVWGTPTAASDMPRTGTATYTGIVDGYYGANRLLDSTGTLSADFANATISTQLALRTGFEIGTLSGSGTIGGGTNSYQGTLAGSLQGTAVTGTLTGLFFGPGAVETGFTFGVNSTASGTENNVAAIGAFVGRQ